MRRLYLSRKHIISRITQANMKIIGRVVINLESGTYGQYFFDTEALSDTGIPSEMDESKLKATLEEKGDGKWREISKDFFELDDDEQIWGSIVDWMIGHGIEAKECIKVRPFTATDEERLISGGTTDRPELGLVIRELEDNSFEASIQGGVKDIENRDSRLKQTFSNEDQAIVEVEAEKYLQAEFKEVDWIDNVTWPRSLSLSNNPNI